ncbi:hypothetical protein [Microbacterium sp.]|uniref:hypothetical protein n=1 Tax=Microbacterium sp. TaxID=51671 RepID=UPI002732A372|nr:hypothetical protein [Microbacterium sp.]
MTMTQTLTQRLILALPLVGVAFLLGSIFLPIHFAAIAWVLALVSFGIALTCAIIIQRRDKAELTAPQRRGSR